jgi:hypothetical protein
MSDAELREGFIGWIIVASVALLIPLWRIHKRAGLHPALALLVLVPYAGVLISSLVLAISRWPAVEREPKEQ